MTRCPPRRWALALWGVAALATCGCDYLEDRFRTCGQLRVDLVNSQQTRLPVHIAAEGEPFSDQTLLAAAGSRRLVLCVERGDRERFRAMRDGAVLDTVTCVVSRSREENEGVIARVLWAPGGFLCENW